jgi:Skp family chaperone for outer membrane proteins
MDTQQRHPLKSPWAGWMAAGLLLVTLMASGFQSAQEKVASVDITEVLQKSKLGRESNEKLRSAYQQRSDVITFIMDNPVLTAEQAQTLRNLSLKENVTAQEKQQLEAVKVEIRTAANQRASLASKAGRTAEEDALLNSLNQRVQTAGVVMEQFQQQFSEDMDRIESDLRNEAIGRVKTTTRDIARRNGFTQVFEAQVMIFAANDLTEQVIRAVDQN